MISLPSLRITGTALAIVTLVFGASFPAVVNVFTDLTGGTQGLRIEKITVSAGSPLAVDQARYLVVLVALLLTAAAVLWLDRSRTGRRLRALGDNPIAAATFGIRAPRLRIGIFTASAAITALAGSLFAVTTGFISSTTSFVTVLGSIVFLTALVIGGRAILLGPLIGAALSELLPSQIGQISPEWAYLVYGAILVLLLLFAPAGITGLPYRRWWNQILRRTNRAPLTRKESAS